MPIAKWKVDKRMIGTFGFDRVFENPNAFGTPEGDSFGYAMATCESYTVISAPAEQEDAGRVYVYSNASMSLIRTLTNPNAFSTRPYDWFGISVAVCEDFIIVGASEADNNNDFSGTGKAYIFSATTGSLLFTLTNPNAYGTITNDYFGWSVSISDSYAVVSAPWEDLSGFPDNGWVYVYSTATGALLHSIPNPDPLVGGGKYFGYSVTISETRVVVGSPQYFYVDEYDIPHGVGRAYVYTIVTGDLIRSLDNPNPEARGGSKFGRRVALSGNLLLISAPGDAPEGFKSSGFAYLMDVETGQVIHSLSNPVPENYANFGESLALNSTYIVIGAPYQNDGIGSAFIFSVQSGELLHTIDPTIAGDDFALSVGVRSNKAFVGYPYYANTYWGEGLVYTYTLPAKTTQLVRAGREKVVGTTPSMPIAQFRFQKTATGIQKWSDPFPNSPEYESLYFPYQLIGQQYSADSYYLFAAEDPLYVVSGVAYSANPFRIYTIQFSSGGNWGLQTLNANYFNLSANGISLLQANSSVFAEEGLSSIHFAKTTTPSQDAGITTKLIRLG